MSNDLRDLSPTFSLEQAKEIAKVFYGLERFQRELPSERDQNFLFGNDREKFILKISNIDEDWSIIDMQNNAMKSIGNDPRVIQSIHGKTIEIYENHFIRLITYIEGIPLADYPVHTNKLFFNLGRLLANIDRSLIDFQHSASKRDLYWNMINAQKIISMYKHLILNENHLNIIENILNDWMEFVVPKFSLLRSSIIHNDANDYNIIVQNEDQLSLIDYGDMCQTFLVCETAIACAYCMLNKDNPIEIAMHLIRGYHQTYPLENMEIQLIYYFIRIRLAMSVTISAHQKQIQPDNHYLVISEKPAWNLLEKLHTIDTEFVQNTFRSFLAIS